jgi:hypothetical protein
MNSRVEPEVILWPVVGHGEQDRPRLVVGVDGHDAVGAGLHTGQQPLGGQRVGEHDLDLGGRLLAGHEMRDPLA